MRKYLSIICAITMICSLAGCGSTSSDSSSSSSATTTEAITEATTEKATESATHEQKTNEPAAAETTTEPTTETKKIVVDADPKDIEVNKTPALVTIVVPADIINDQQETVKKAKENPVFDTVEPNADGSITYTMTRKNHEEFMQQISDSFDETMQKLVDQCSTITSIDNNSDYTSFDVNVTNYEQYQNSLDSAALAAITITSSYYAHFNGKNISQDDIKVRIIEPDGTIVQQQ